MEIQRRLLQFVTRANWILFATASLAAVMAASADFARGVVFGGLIVTVNFHFLAKTLKKALTPPHLASPNAVLVKYYLRFTLSGFIIFLLIATKVVNPIGLVLGLSVVVTSIMCATVYEAKKILFKEAV
ncbi:MAG: ATP synthase subunit I [Deltaproteobacteria bacterium SG8_13]|nr:MAG: ATP synthase subunit I [Deltaproteobacteria bacterium SG8_13]